MVASRHWRFNQPICQIWGKSVPLVLTFATVAEPSFFISQPKDKTNLSHDGLTPAHVPCWWMNNPTLCPCCEAMIGRADIEGSKSNVAMNAWLPQASYPCGNFSDTSGLTRRAAKGSLGPAFTSATCKSHVKQASALVLPPRFPSAVSPP